MSFSRWIASGFGSGFAPHAPGTAGSLVGLAIGWALLASSHAALLAGAAIAVAAGSVATRAATGLPWLGTTKGADDDPGWVVVDEIAGQMLAMLALPRPGFVGAALAFALFRLFDIAKPGPVGWLDRQGGAAGIMADDVLAGGLAALCLVLILRLVPALS